MKSVPIKTLGLHYWCLVIKTDFDKYEGIVVALKANYLIVEIKSNSFKLKSNDTKIIRLLCTRRQKLDHSGTFIRVGDNVLVEAIDWQSLRGVISFLEPRFSSLKRPAVANVTDIFVCISVAQPPFDFDQASRFLVTAEQASLNVNIVLTKIDLNLLALQ